MKLSSPHRYNAFGRRQMAIHEAGHVCVALRFGLKSRAIVWQSEEGLRGVRGVTVFSKTDLKSLRTPVRHLFALGGAAAQMKMAGLSASKFFVAMRDYSVLSRSDIELLGFAPDRDQPTKQMVVEKIEQLINMFQRDELMRVSTEILRMSKEEKYINLFSRVRKYCEQKYPFAVAATAR